MALDLVCLRLLIIIVFFHR